MRAGALRTVVPVGVLLGPIDDLADVRGELSWGARGGLLGLRDLDGGQHGGAGDDGDQRFFMEKILSKR